MSFDCNCVVGGQAARLAKQQYQHSAVVKVGGRAFLPNVGQGMDCRALFNPVFPCQALTCGICPVK